MILDANISKSFYMMGNSLNHCYDCKYCRLIGEDNNSVNYNIIPTEINPNFSSITVAINLFYGDPLLQIDNTVDILRRLEKANHKGPVIIITKGDISKFPDVAFNLDLHFAFSTFGMNSRLDGNTMERFLQNLDAINNRKYKYRYSIEFRPIVYGVNDSKETIENVMKIASEYNLPVGYCGLQGKPDMVKYWRENNLDFKPYPGFTFGHKKSLSDDVLNLINEASVKYEVPIFKKTSCLISYVHSFERDYNAHYYRPTEMGCEHCVMKNKCMAFKESLDKNKTILTSELIPFEHNIRYKEKHECILKKQGTCEFPSDDCSNIKGNIVKINKDITTADVRMIKWLTGLTVEANFVESPFLSDEWDMRQTKRL